MGLQYNGGPSVDAGTVTFDGVLQPVVLLPTKGFGGPEYAGIVEPSLLFAPDAVITVTATGGDIPGFTAGLAAPSPITLTQPVAPGSGWTIDPTTDLTISWSGTTTGVVDVQLLSANIDFGETVDCQFPASDGSGTVPAALVGYGVRTNQWNTYAIASLGEARADGSTGYAVDLRASYVANWSDGSLAMGPVTMPAP
jgi:hypothetical protein